MNDHSYNFKLKKLRLTLMMSKLRMHVIWLLLHIKN